MRRNVNRPIFTLQTYSTTISERASIGVSVISVSANDADGDRLFYSLIDDARCLDAFYLGPDNGILYLKETLLNAVENAFTCTVSVTDRGYPVPQTDSATMVVNVDRDTTLPVFTQNARYTDVIPENTEVGTSLLTVQATRQNIINRIYYEVIGDYPAPSFFTVDNTTGVVSTKADLRIDNLGLVFYVITVRAQDNVAQNQQFATAEVIVTVLRDLFGPVFRTLPTTISLNEDDFTTDAIFTASATDADLQGEIRYEVTGIFPSQSFFNVDSVTGAVTLRNSLLSDAEGRTEYTLRFQAYDTAYPNDRAQADLSVRVVRNRNGPVFTQGRYEFTIAETFPLGDIIGSVTAMDADQDQVTFTSLASGAAANLFFLNQESGTISLRSPLLGSQSNQYAFEVEASDNRAASIVKRSRVTVTISVLRDSGPPVFQNTPYMANVPITRAVNSTIFTVRATDPDLKGQIQYRLDGYQPGTLYFSLDPNSGAIIVRRDLTVVTDVFATYTFRVIARDLAANPREGFVSVSITILRNEGTPQFVDTNRYAVTVSEAISVLDTIIQVSATDPDPVDTPNGQLSYSIVGPAPAKALFQIDPVSGIITARVSLTTAPNDLYRVSLSELFTFSH